MLSPVLSCTIALASLALQAPPAAPAKAPPVGPPPVVPPGQGNPATIDPAKVPIAPTTPTPRTLPGGIKLEKVVRDPLAPPTLLEAPRNYSDPLTVQADLPKMELTLTGSKSEGKFDVEIASDFDSRRTGLGGRAEFKAGTGMLFIHPATSVYSYWMKDVPFPIDMVYIDYGGKIAALQRMKPQPRLEGEDPLKYELRLKQYSSNHPVNFALELPAGSIETLGLTLGRKVLNDPVALLKLCEGKRQS